MDKVGNQQSSIVEMIVVDIYEPCPCHSVVTTRGKVEDRWIFFGVKNPCGINFGDTILYNEARDEIHLRRNTKLTFKIITSELTEECIVQLARECPPMVQPGDFPELDYFPK